MRREERVTVQGPVKEQQSDGMSHRGLARGGGGGANEARARPDLRLMKRGTQIERNARSG